MSEKNDKPRSGGKPQGSVRRLKTGLALLDGATSLKRAMVRAGYSPWTARAPKRNFVTVGQAVKDAIAYRKETSPELGDLKPLAIDTLAAVMNDPEEPGATRTAAAATTLKLVQEAGEEPAEVGVSTETLDRAAIEIYRAAWHGAMLAVRIGPRALGLIRRRLVDLGDEEEAAAAKSLRAMVAFPCLDVSEAPPPKFVPYSTTEQERESPDE